MTHPIVLNTPKSNTCSKLSTRAIASAVFLGITCGSLHANTVERDSCFDLYISDLQGCNDSFNDSSHPNYLNNQAWNACRSGAIDARNACQNSENDPRIDDFWNEFISNLQSCIDTFGENSDDPAANPENLQDCIEQALANLRQQLDNLTEDEPCDSDLIPQNSYHGSVYVGPMNTLELAASQLGSTDGKYPVKVNTSMNISSGINITPGGQYDASQIPCIKSAIAIAIYQTKFGTSVIPMDADFDTSDGTNFDIMFFGNDLIDASDVSILTIFFDQNDLPSFGELGHFTIEGSSIPGDWNRDEVLNTQDAIDFLDSYEAQTKRTDLNNDNQINTEDVEEFVHP